MTHNEETVRNILWPPKTVQNNSGYSPIDANDPRTMLTIKATQKKALHIHNFLHEATKRNLKRSKKDLVLSRDEVTNIETVVVCNDENHPYAGISVSEWAGANCRLLNQLLASGDLPRSNIEFYLAYTATVMDFANNYEWSNVLDFDYNYREQQSAHGFQWGHINPMMRLHFLSQPRQRPQVKQNQRRGFGTNTQQEECRQWKANNGYCSFGKSCRYKHVYIPSSQVLPRQPMMSKNEGRQGTKLPI